MAINHHQTCRWCCSTWSCTARPASLLWSLYSSTLVELGSSHGAVREVTHHSQRRGHTLGDRIIRHLVGAHAGLHTQLEIMCSTGHVTPTVAMTDVLDVGRIVVHASWDLGVDIALLGDIPQMLGDDRLHMSLGQRHCRQDWCY